MTGGLWGWEVDLLPSLPSLYQTPFTRSIFLRFGAAARNECNSNVPPTYLPTHPIISLQRKKKKEERCKHIEYLFYSETHTTKRD